METTYKQFIKFLDDENKDQAVLLIHELLDKDHDIVDIYENYLIPSLRDYECKLDEAEICIWKEHTRTSIVRTILESTYPYLIKQKKKKTIDQSIVLACPQEEYHEIGALISTNYFYLMGFKVKYIGANTPSDEIESAIGIMKPDFLALSITNYYNLLQVKKLVERLNNTFPDLKIILGGQASVLYADKAKIPYNFILSSYEDIVAFRGELS